MNTNEEHIMNTAAQAVRNAAMSAAQRCIENHDSKPSTWEDVDILLNQYEQAHARDTVYMAAYAVL